MKSNLGIFGHSDGIQQVASFRSSFRSVGLHKSSVPHCCSKELKVLRNFASAIGMAQQGIRQGAMESWHGLGVKCHRFALCQVEVQAKVGRPLLHET
jgi:hypothetical protein